jgi:hypothetical protein
MSVSRQGIRLAVALLVCLSVLGCSRGRNSQVAEPLSSLSSSTDSGSSAEPESATTGKQTPDAQSDATPGKGPRPPSYGAPGAPGGSSNSQPNRAPGAPGPSGGGGNKPKALGAPLKIPTIEQKGVPIGQVLDSIRQRFVDACGGRLCVTLVISPSSTDPETDGLVGTNPSEGSKMTPGMKVQLLCKPLEEEQPPDSTTPDSTTPDSTTPEDTTATAPDDGEPPSSS